MCQCIGNGLSGTFEPCIKADAFVAHHFIGRVFIEQGAFTPLPPRACALGGVGVFFAPQVLVEAVHVVLKLKGIVVTPMFTGECLRSALQCQCIDTAEYDHVADIPQASLMHQEHQDFLGGVVAVPGKVEPHLARQLVEPRSHGKFVSRGPHTQSR